MQTDESLALGIQKGNRHDLSELVNRHHSSLIGYLYRMTGGDRVLAEDMAQEAFVRVLRSIDHYLYPRPFKPWLYQIATNLVRDHYKRAETRYAVTLSDSTPHHATGLEEIALAVDESQQVALALAALPDHQREAVVLRYYQELSLAEIAEVLSIPVGTVKSRLSLGLRQLRDTMGEV